MRHLGIPSFDGLMALPVRRDNLQVSSVYCLYNCLWVYGVSFEKRWELIVHSLQHSFNYFHSLNYVFSRVGLRTFDRGRRAAP